MRVGLFDSGIGGLTVLKRLILEYPNNEYIYYGDNVNVPYGNKSIQELLVLADNNIKFLKERNVEVIIIACGTVSSCCFKYLSDRYDIPIYDIISPTINYLNHSSYKNILVIATKRTINSHIFMNSVSKNIIEIETPLLASLIENNELDDIDLILHKYLDNYVKKVDAIVLGCTHYPIISSDIQSILPGVDVIDMASNVVLDNDGKKGLEIYFSKLDDKLIKNVKRILNNDDVNIKLANANSKE